MQLNDKQREVVDRRFGLHGYDTATLEEVGNEIGVTRERVRQIQLEAMKRLREILENDENEATIQYLLPEYMEQTKDLLLNCLIDNG